MADARAACSPLIESKLSRPQTVDYDFGGANIHTEGPNVIWSTTGSAKNAFDVEIDFKAWCYIRNGTITKVEVDQN